MNEDTQITLADGEWKWYQIAALAVGVSAGLIALGWFTEEKGGDEEHGGGRGRPQGRRPAHDDDDDDGPGMMQGVSQQQLQQIVKKLLEDLMEAEVFVDQHLPNMLENVQPEKALATVKAITEAMMQQQLRIDSIPQLQAGGIRKTLTDRVHAVLQKLDDAGEAIERSQSGGPGSYSFDSSAFDVE